MSPAGAGLSALFPPQSPSQTCEQDESDWEAAASRDADMLVVGEVRQRFAKLLGGSVSSKVMHHAACPVVVVPGVHPAA